MNVAIFGLTGFVGLLVLLFIWLFIGAIIGAVAGILTGSDRSFMSNAFVGIIGSYVGGVIAWAFGMGDGNLLGNFIFAVIGSVALTFLGRAIRKT